MQKIVINDCYGGFGLSWKAGAEYTRRTGRGCPAEPGSNIGRDDPALVGLVEEMGSGASGPGANLRVVEIPDGVEWQIEEYDGSEWVAEKHRTWR